MTLFDFLKILNQEMIEYELEKGVLSTQVLVIVERYPDKEIYWFDEDGIVKLISLKLEFTTEDREIIETRINGYSDWLLKTWIEASKDLGITFITPYIFKGIDGNDYRATGLLPDFGSGKGVLIIADKCGDMAQTMAEFNDDYYYSVGGYQKYGRETFIRMLSDWGWISDKLKPAWLDENWRDKLEDPM